MPSDASLKCRYIAKYGGRCASIESVLLGRRGASFSRRFPTVRRPWRQPDLVAIGRSGSAGKKLLIGREKLGCLVLPGQLLDYAPAPDGSHFGAPGRIR